MQTITKVSNTAGELKTQKVKKEETDYSGLIVGMIFLALGAAVFIISAMGYINN